MLETKVRVLSDYCIDLSDCPVEINNNIILWHLGDIMYVMDTLATVSHVTDFLLERRIDRLQTMMMDFLCYELNSLTQCLGGEPARELKSLLAELESRRYRKNIVSLGLIRKIGKTIKKIWDEINPLYRLYAGYHDDVLDNILGKKGEITIVEEENKTVFK